MAPLPKTPSSPASASTSLKTSSFPSKYFEDVRAVSKTNDFLVLATIRTLADFQTEGVSEQIASMRLEYYEGKRRVHTK